MTDITETLLQADRTLTLVLNGSESLYLDALAVTATRTAVWLPVALVLLYVIIRNNNLPGVFLTVAGLGLCVLLSDQIASSVFKPLVARFRPSQDPHLMYLVRVVNDYRGGLYGFFSSHAANTVSLAVFFSLVTRHRATAATLGAWAALCCWTRVYLGVHYAGDILAGCLCGLVVGTAVWLLWRGVSARLHVAAQPADGTPHSSASVSAGGYDTGTLWLLTAAFCATLLYIAFRALFVAV